MKVTYKGNVFEHGSLITCSIGNNGDDPIEVVGRLCINNHDNGVYICQNERSGANGAEDNFGYTFSWIIGRRYEEEDMRGNRVTPKLVLNGEASGLKKGSRIETLEDKKKKAIKLLTRCGILEPIKKEKMHFCKAKNIALKQLKAKNKLKDKKKKNK